RLHFSFRARGPRVTEERPLRGDLFSPAPSAPAVGHLGDDGSVSRKLSRDRAPSPDRVRWSRVLRRLSARPGGVGGLAEMKLSRFDSPPPRVPHSPRQVETRRRGNTGTRGKTR